MVSRQTGDFLHFSVLFVLLQESVTQKKTRGNIPRRKDEGFKTWGFIEVKEDWARSALVCGFRVTEIFHWGHLKEYLTYLGGWQCFCTRREPTGMFLLLVRTLLTPNWSKCVWRKKRERKVSSLAHVKYHHVHHPSLSPADTLSQVQVQSWDKATRTREDFHIDEQTVSPCVQVCRSG